MPARIHRNVRAKVCHQLFLAALSYLQEQADAHLASDPLMEGEGLVLATHRAFWTIEKNMMGVSYVKACVTFTDRHTLHRSWRVPRMGRGSYKGGTGLLWIKYLPLDKYHSLPYTHRARGGALGAPGGAAKPTTRSRPAIGRRFRDR